MPFGCEVVKIVSANIERTSSYEQALSGVYDSMSPGRFLKIKKEFFTAFFEVAAASQI